MTRRRRAARPLGVCAFPDGVVGYVMLAMLAAGLVGCGSTIYTAGAGVTSAASTSASSTKIASTATSTPRVVGGAQLNGCPVQQVPANASIRGDVIVSSGAGEAAFGQGSQQAQLRKGQTLEVQLPAAERWRVVMQAPGQVLTPATSNGWYDPSLRACVWRFTASATGNASLQFAGTAVCAPSTKCPIVAFSEQINVAVQA
jgi:hypothetical protein